MTKGRSEVWKLCSHTRLGNERCSTSISFHLKLSIGCAFSPTLHLFFTSSPHKHFWREDLNATLCEDWCLVERFSSIHHSPPPPPPLRKPVEEEKKTHKVISCILSVEAAEILKRKNKKRIWFKSSNFAVSYFLFIKQHVVYWEAWNCWPPSPHNSNKFANKFPIPCICTVHWNLPDVLFEICDCMRHFSMNQEQCYSLFWRLKTLGIWVQPHRELWRAALNHRRRGVWTLCT